MSDNLIGGMSPDTGAPSQAAPSTGEAPSSNFNVQPTAPHWTASLPEDIRTSPSIQKFNDPAGLAKSYLELEKGYSSRAKIPTEYSSPEEVAEFYTKLGRPNDPTGYKYTLDDGTQQMVVPELLQEFSGLAHSLGLSNKQADELVKFQTSLLSNQNQIYEKAMADAMYSLKNEWGNNFDSNLKNADSMFNQYKQKYPQEAEALRVAAGNNTLLARIFADMASKTRETSSVGGTSAQGFGGGRADAMNKIAAMKNDLSHPLWNAGHPQHYKAMQEYDELSRLAYGDPNNNG